MDASEAGSPWGWTSLAGGMFSRGWRGSCHWRGEAGRGLEWRGTTFGRWPFNLVVPLAAAKLRRLRDLALFLALFLPAQDINDKTNAIVKQPTNPDP